MHEAAITSRHNAVVQDVRALARKREGDRFLLEGSHVLAEALDADVRVDLLLHTERVLQDPLYYRARSVARRTLRVSEAILEHVADSQHPQGFVAVARVPEGAVDTVARGRPARVVVLDRVRDPGNLGTIVRTCRAAFADALILVGPCVDPWSPKVVRAAAGALFHVPILHLRDADAMVEWLAARGVRAVGATAAAEQTCFDADLRRPVALLMGNEAHGLDPALEAACDETVRIPMAEGSESLNLAVATAVLLYQSLQQEA